MDSWMKGLWALAALAAVVALVALAGTPGGSPPVATGGPAPEYFTVHDPNRSVVDYGVRENGRARIYSSRIAR